MNLKIIKDSVAGRKGRKTNIKRVKDSFETDYLAESVTQEDVWDLIETGSLNVKIPSEVSDVNEFAESVESRIIDMWGESDVNFKYPEAIFAWEQAGDELVFTWELA